MSLDSKTMDCSIIICTRDRASMLKTTLLAFNRVHVPAGWKVEMIVADNGSTDETAQIVANTAIPHIELHYLFEPLPGKSRAQNAALAKSRGAALLFTDDDVLPAENWLEFMARPLLEGRCDAVGGRIKLADGLRRPWMRPLHLLWLADIPSPASSEFGLVGASMGVHRSVFERLGCFDEYLGPGASGFGEETLLWMQMLETGMRVLPVSDTHVIHCPDASRLRRGCWLDAAKRFGQTRAYVMHHWEHVGMPHPRIDRLWNLLKLFIRKPLRFLASPDEEGCADWEMSYLVRISCCEHFIHEARTPRKYSKRGLRKRTEGTIFIKSDAMTAMTRA